MKRNMLNKFLIAGALMLASMIALQSMTVIAEGGDTDDDEVDGQLTSQNYNNRAFISEFDLRDSSDGQVVAETHSLTPTESYTVQITVSDPDTIADLNSLEVRFFYSEVDLASESLTPSSFQGDFEADRSKSVDDSGNAFVVSWNDGDSVFSISNGALSSADYTWSLDNSTVPNESNDNDTEFTFEFDFTISKVANHSVGHLKWYFGTIINDGNVSLTSGSDSDIVDFSLKQGEFSDMSSETPSGWEMDFYGEIIVSQSAIAWNDVAAGETFTDSNSNSNLSNTKYISNGKYHSEIRSSAIWEAVLTADQLENLESTLFSGFTEDDFADFAAEYVKQLSPGAISSATTATTASALAGLTYGQFNQVALKIANETPSGVWSGVAILLPQSSESANLTGASIVTDGSIDSAGFTEQFFMIGYDDEDITPPEKYATNYGLVGTDYRRFKSESNDQNKTNEAGDTVDVTLYLHLSSVFQNARYEGVISLQIVNDPS